MSTDRERDNAIRDFERQCREGEKSVSSLALRAIARGFGKGFWRMRYWLAASIAYYVVCQAAIALHLPEVVVGTLIGSGGLLVVGCFHTLVRLIREG